jgi:predicted aminopeptidase
LQVALLAALLSLSAGCYLLHVAFGQLHVSCASIDVEEALRDPTLDETARARIRFIGDVKRFGQDRLGMEPSDNYTTYYPGDPNQPMTWVVTAAEKLRLQPVTHWYPIVGTVTYKGFFDLESAREEADDQEEDGYDVCLRPAAAYSTLGWFTDPITPMMLRYDEPQLAELILHELAHGEVYASGQTDFNESLAEFVGRAGALQMAAERWGADAAQVRLLNDRAADEALFDATLLALRDRLAKLYDSNFSDEQKLAERERIFASAAEELKALQPRLRVRTYRDFAEAPLNNAVLLAHLTYRDTAPFEALFEKVGRSWPRWFEAVRRAAEADAPFEALRLELQE